MIQNKFKLRSREQGGVFELIQAIIEIPMPERYLDMNVFGETKLCKN